jgi:D-3-phosphoglycerate dehydrogenase
VTRASAGFVPAVTELVLEVSRGPVARRLAARATRSVPRAAAVPAAVMGRQLAGGTLGVIGYGAIGQARGGRSDSSARHAGVV